MRVVLDTNILVRALARASGPAPEVLRLVVESDHTLVISAQILTELERVLAYPRLQARWPLTPSEIAEFVVYLDRVSEVIPLSAPSTTVSVRDPDDDHVIQTAVSGRADVLCTRDRHFGDSTVQAYCSARNIRILDELQLLNMLRGTA